MLMNLLIIFLGVVSCAIKEPQSSLTIEQQRKEYLAKISNKFIIKSSTETLQLGAITSNGEQIDLENIPTVMTNFDNQDLGISPKMPMQLIQIINQNTAQYRSLGFFTITDESSGVPLPETINAKYYTVQLHTTNGENITITWLYDGIEQSLTNEFLLIQP